MGAAFTWPGKASHISVEFRFQIVPVQAADSCKLGSRYPERRDGDSPTWLRAPALLRERVDMSAQDDRDDNQWCSLGLS
jgi:hypothetical protein